MFNFFSKKNKANLVNDFSSISVDLHSHLIPGIDDGSQTLEESVNLVIEMKKLGFKKLITTPHIMSDYFKNTPEIILNGLQLLKDELKKQQIDMEIEAAAEYYYDEYFTELLNKGELLSISNQFILFELSYINPSHGVRELIFQIQQRGFKPLLAHPERYPYLSWDDYVEYKRAGCYFQLNLMSLTEHYGKYPKKIAQKLIDHEMIDFIASDLHKLRHIDQLHLTLKEKYLKKIMEYEFLLNETLL
jgi:protein-tyrosine phosphatase